MHRLSRLHVIEVIIISVPLSSILNFLPFSFPNDVSLQFLNMQW